MSNDLVRILGALRQARKTQSSPQVRRTTDLVQGVSELMNAIYDSDLNTADRAMFREFVREWTIRRLEELL